MQEVISQSLIVQVSHFTRFEQLLEITQVFKLSLLFRTQWGNNPAVAIASLIINAYKRRSILIAQNADLAPIIVAVTYLRFMKHVQIYTCALYANHTHTHTHTHTHLRMAEKTHYSQVIVLSGPNSDLYGM